MKSIKQRQYAVGMVTLDIVERCLIVWVTQVWVTLVFDERRLIVWGTQVLVTLVIG